MSRSQLHDFCSLISLSPPSHLFTFSCWVASASRWLAKFDETCSREFWFKISSFSTLIELASSWIVWLPMFRTSSLHSSRLFRKDSDRPLSSSADQFRSSSYHRNWRPSLWFPCQRLFCLDLFSEGHYEIWVEGHRRKQRKPQTFVKRRSGI